MNATSSFGGKRMRLKRIILPALLLVLLVGGLAGCATAPYTGRQQLILVPEDQMTQMGRQYAAEVRKEGAVVTGTPFADMVAQVGARIAQVTETPDTQWNFSTIKGDDLNAFALPGGEVFVYTGMEKIAEYHPYPNYMPFTDRINYLEAMFTNQAWAMAVERLLEIEVPKRAEYLRVIACELNRIANHCVTLGCISMDLGAYTPFVYLLREREVINDLFEELCGNRLTFNYMRIGGVSLDAPAGWFAKVEAFLDKFDKVMVELQIGRAHV